MICCPMKRSVKGYPFEVAIAPGRPGDAPSVALADRVKGLDWRARRTGWKGRATDAELAAGRARAVALIRGR
jgi:mRNA interferase MazF